MDEFWNEVRQILIDDEDSDGYGVEDVRLVDKAIAKVKTADGMAEFLYTYSKDLNG